MTNRLVVQFLFITFILFSHNAFAAQSTADVPVTEELKASASSLYLVKAQPVEYQKRNM